MHHRVVIRPERERKLKLKRVIFDASSKTENGISLNDCLETGPALLPELVNVLLRFREHRVAIMADIRKIYLQVKLREEDHDVFRLLWRDMNSDTAPRIMRIVTLHFGAKPCRFFGNRDNKTSRGEE